MDFTTPQEGNYFYYKIKIENCMKIETFGVACTPVSKINVT